MRTRIGIAGWFGSENFGDELLLRALAEPLKAGGADVVVFCPGPEVVTRRHGYEAIPLPTRRLGFAGSLAVVREIRSCTTVVLGPGTIFQERSPVIPWPGTIPLLLRFALMVRLTGASLCIFGAAVREDTTPLGRIALRIIGRLARSVAVRDRPSADFFGARAIVIGDVATTCPPDQLAAPAAVGSFGLSVRPLEGAQGARLGKVLGAVTQALISDEGMTGCFIPMALGRSARGEDDREVFERYFKNSINMRSDHFQCQAFRESLQRWFDLLAEQELLIATRLHACIGGVLCGVPTVAISYERKVEKTFAALDLSDYVVGLDTSFDELMSACHAARSPAGRRQAAAARARAIEQGHSVRELIGRLSKGW